MAEMEAVMMHEATAYRLVDCAALHPPYEKRWIPLSIEMTRVVTPADAGVQVISHCVPLVSGPGLQPPGQAVTRRNDETA